MTPQERLIHIAHLGDQYEALNAELIEIHNGIRSERARYLSLQRRWHFIHSKISTLSSNVRVLRLLRLIESRIAALDARLLARENRLLHLRDVRRNLDHAIEQVVRSSPEPLP